MAEVLPHSWAEDMSSAQPGPGKLWLLACNSELRLCSSGSSSEDLRGHQGYRSQPPVQGSQGKPKTHGARGQASWKAEHMEEAHMVGGESMKLPEWQSAGGGQLNCGNLWAQLPVVFEARRVAAAGCRGTVIGKSQTCREGLWEGGKASCGGNSGTLNINFSQWTKYSEWF